MSKKIISRRPIDDHAASLPLARIICGWSFGCQSYFIFSLSGFVIARSTRVSQFRRLENGSSAVGFFVADDLFFELRDRLIV